MLEEAQYYQAIEEAFVSLRGDPLFLSNADWDSARRWRLAGTPLRVVLRGITDAVDSHAHSWGRKRKIASLRYCAAEVERARERWTRALAEGQPEAGRIHTALRSVAARLGQAQLPGDRATQVARQTAEGILSRLESFRAETMDAWLAEAERELIAALDLDEGKDPSRRAMEQADRDLAAYEGRIPKKLLEQIRHDAATRLRLAALGLPRLSLFHISEGFVQGESGR